MIRLIGVKPKNHNSSAARRYLTNKILRRQIFLKYDEIKHDNENRLMAYVYLKNKTFINAHLLKEGFAELDQEYPFKFLSKFKKLRNEKVIDENPY